MSCLTWAFDYFAGSKSTPRTSGLIGQQVITPPPTIGTQPLAQYQYTFPNVVKVAPQQQSHNLSVVSAPAPVIHRPELSSAGGGQPILISGPPSGLTPQPTLENISGLRSTKSQRIRGATNNIRMKQLEMRENHAVVYSWWFFVTA